MEAPTTTTYRVDELDCATEEQELRGALGALDGVEALGFDLVGRRVAVTHRLVDPRALEDAIRGLGMRAHEVPTTDLAAPSRGLPRRRLLTTIAAGALAVGSELVVIAGEAEQSPVVAAMALGAIALGGRDTLRKGARALVARRLTMSLLMSVAVLGAIAIGQWPEAAVVIWLFGLAELIEARSLERARDAIRSLVALAPETAWVRDGEAIVDRPAGQIAVGAVVVVRPGERVALDGTVVGGSTSVDQAPITGESLPVAKAAGDHVFGGTINQHGTIDVRVTAAKGEGTLDRIARSVQEAQADRAPAQRFVDRFAAVYTPIVFVLAIATASLPVVLGHGSLRDWVYRALVLLVVACPCALVISTPVTVVAGLGGAARRGILVKAGGHLERARRIRVVALDKTGTLTLGRPEVASVEVVDADLDADAVRRLAASLEARSEHAVARAVVADWPGPIAPVEAFTAIPGRGVSATIDGRRYHLGNHLLAEERGRCDRTLEARLDVHERAGRTAVVLMDDDHVLGVLAVADGVRPESPVAVAELRRLGVDVVMLTGDNGHTAEAVARRVGVREVHGDLLPEDKVALVHRLRGRGPVAMVGDGINDAPALATADLGVAMGAAGTDTAIETADVALMDDDPRKVAELIRISQHTTHVLWQNIAFAIAVKAAFVALTLSGLASLWVAVLADMGASLLVIANGLRLVRRPSHRPAGGHPTRKTGNPGAAAASTSSLESAGSPSKDRPASRAHAAR